MTGPAEFERIAAFREDPLGFVRDVFPWGEGALIGEDGPDEWQAAFLGTLGEEVASARDAVKIAVASGHGVGKTALCAWILLWFLSTRPHPQVVVTANTKPQLEGKTWRELAKWHKLARHGHWFEWTATKFYLGQHPETWFASAVPWSRERSEAFAGTHEKHVLVVFDEASAIADEIWDVTEGAMTTPAATWLVFGNPTRNAGRFRECWRRYRHRWITREVDSRTAKKANKTQIEKWVADYGEDSDFVRVRVRGVFPRAASSQFIGSDAIFEAQRREPPPVDHAPVVMGVDVARFGDDQSVILVRQGQAVLDVQGYRGLDTMQTAARVGEAIRKWRPNGVLIDGVGVGGGVVDRVRQLGFRVTDVNAGAKAGDANSFYNLRAEMWSKMRDWLGAGCLPADHRELADDLMAPEYGFDGRNRLQIEKKDDMKARGVPSPDWGDALALTFAAPVGDGAMEHRPAHAEAAYDPFDHDGAAGLRPRAGGDFSPI